VYNGEETIMPDAQQTPTITVRPERPLIDDRLAVTIAGLPPRQEVTCRAEMRDGFGRRWVSAATFLSDADGCVDLTTQAPVSGAYAGVDPMGLFWTLALDPPDAAGPLTPMKQSLILH
jgi:hypothetical protein